MFVEEGQNVKDTIAGILLQLITKIVDVGWVGVYTALYFFDFNQYRSLHNSALFICSNKVNVLNILRP